MFVSPAECCEEQQICCMGNFQDCKTTRDENRHVCCLPTHETGIWHYYTCLHCTCLH